MHFTTPSYCFFKYNGKVKITAESYQKRHDKQYFFKLSKKKDPKGLVVSNLISNPKMWITECLSSEGETTYMKWLTTQQSLQYQFCRDLDKLFNISDNLDDVLIVNNGQYPHLLKMVNQHQINIETLIILNQLMGFVSMWKKKIEDQVLWPDFHSKVVKYTPFINVDIKLYTKLVLNKYTH